MNVPSDAASGTLGTSKPPKSARPGKAAAAAKKTARSWMRNVSKFARDVHQAAHNAQASSLMPQVHPPSSRLLPRVDDTVAAVVSSSGSVVSQVGTAATSLGSIMQRTVSVAKAIHEADRQRELHSTKRRLNQEAVEAFYAEIDQRTQARLLSNQAYTNFPRRRLESSDVGWTPPDWYVKNHGWIAGAVDWRKVVAEVHRSSRKLLQRHDYVLDHIDRTGNLPSGRVKEEHQTGIGILDLNAPPSVLGNMLRGAHDWVTNRYSSEPLKRVRARRLKESRSAARPTNSNPNQQSTLVAAIGAALAGRDPIDAAWETMETASHHSHSRNLAESFLGAAASVPIMGARMSNKYTSYEATGGGVDWLQESVRYLVYDTLLCYLYDPSGDNANDADFGDGTTVKTHRTRKMCFPAIPSGPTKMELFRDYYGVGDLDFKELEFEKACKSDAVRGVLGSLGEDWARNVITTAPMGSILRVAEGIDSVRNLARSGMGNATEMERGAAIVCGLSQLGGLLFSAMAIAISLALLVCAPLGSAAAVMLYKCCRRNLCTVKENAKRERQIDEMLAERNLKVARSDTTKDDNLQQDRVLEARSATLKRWRSLRHASAVACGGKDGGDRARNNDAAPIANDNAGEGGAAESGAGEGGSKINELKGVKKLSNVLKLDTKIYKGNGEENLSLLDTKE